MLYVSTKRNNMQIDHAKDLNIVMSMCNLIEYSNNYLKTPGSLWQYYRDESALDNNNNISNFPGNGASFKFKAKITGKLPDDGNRKDVKIAVPLKDLSNFWRTLEMPLIVKLILY